MLLTWYMFNKIHLVEEGINQFTKYIMPNISWEVTKRINSNKVNIFYIIFILPFISTMLCTNTNTPLKVLENSHKQRRHLLLMLNPRNEREIPIIVHRRKAFCKLNSISRITSWQTWQPLCIILWSFHFTIRTGLGDCWAFSKTFSGWPETCSKDDNYLLHSQHSLLILWIRINPQLMHIYNVLLTYFYVHLKLYLMSLINFPNVQRSPSFWYPLIMDCSDAQCKV